MADTTQHDAASVAAMIEDLKIGMFTTVDADGALVSRPMSTQDVDESTDLWFITQRGQALVAAIETHPQVNVAYAGKGTWVSVAGTASVVEDRERMHRYWDRLTDAFTEGGPDSPENVLVKVETDSAEYWGGDDDGAGNRAAQIVKLVKAAVTGERPEGRNATVEL